MLQSGAANQTRYCIIPHPSCQRLRRVEQRLAHYCPGAIAPVGGLSDNGARTGR